MRLGVTSYAFTWEVGVPGYVFPEADPAPHDDLTAAALLERAAGHGVSVVQILDNLPLHLAAPQEIRNLKERADRLRLSLEVGTRGIEPEHLRTYLRLARELDSPLVRIVVDTSARRPTSEEVVSSLRDVLPDYEAAGVDLAIENHDRFESQVLLRILESVGSERLGICLDTVNSFGALERPEIVVAALGPYAMSVHVKDFEVRRAAHAMGIVVEGEPAGRGRLDIPWLLSEVRRFGRDPNAVLELWTPPEATRSATIAKERRWAEESIAYLRRYLPD